MATRGTILVVDDTPEIADLLRGVLESHGYRVLVAPTAEVGVQILRAFRVGLVVTDALRPEDAEPDNPWGGLDRLAAAARETPLALCAPGDTGQYAAHAAHGFAACLTKPLDLDTLLALVGSLLLARGQASPVAPGRPATVEG